MIKMYLKFLNFLPDQITFCLICLGVVGGRGGGGGGGEGVGVIQISPNHAIEKYQLNSHYN